MASVSRESAARSPELLQERLVAFCVEVWAGTENLRSSPTVARLRDQLMRAATSVAAHYAEARAAESRRDYLHKMQICLKELRETGVWLEVLARIEGPLCISALERECSELTAIFVTSIKTVRTPRPRR